MHINISSGNHDILATGQAFLFDQSDRLFVTISNDSYDMNIIFEFIQDDSKKRIVKSEIVDGNLVIRCINFKEQNAGLTKPINIGTIDGKKISVMFWSYLEGADSPIRSIRYTFFAEKNPQEKL